MDVLIDTGILLRLLHRADPKNGPIRETLRELKKAGDVPVATTQNIAEFWNVCTRPASARGGLGLSNMETAKRLRTIERLVRILPDSPATYSIWKNLVVSLSVSGVQVHDARLVAAMKVHGVTHILTLNGADFLRYPGITVLEPISRAVAPQS